MQEQLVESIRLSEDWQPQSAIQSVLIIKPVYNEISNINCAVVYHTVIAQLFCCFVTSQKSKYNKQN